ncbi:protein O-glucosyltransferase 2 [Octopus bimaculoides]|uniref:Glycosyl transferase CAP10 domain-containing protein n=1 Tax=Octopus bimaculoides TaxID=37653 RepID=A0A0L8HNG2_OCTBM|nr:protein O-glucosyltransferase 2 [Octopus bimaculoides]|eukprot:XP_014770860.1 PREDICTED: KDEL motif-containing protein 1-like [Octopus bimaculoides]
MIGKIFYFKIFLSCFLAIFNSYWLCVDAVSKTNVDRNKTLVWGIGLRANATLPVRYFFIQAVDRFGRNFTESVGEKAFHVSLSVKGTHVWYGLNVLDRQDGSYIVRYRLHRSYKDIEIHVKHKGKHVSSSPFTLHGTSYHEDCYCPVLNFDKWLKVMECPSTYKQIDDDLKIWQNAINMEKLAPKIVKRFNQHGQHSICHYKIINNKLSRKCYGEHTGFSIFSDTPFLSLARKVILPDMEFFINLGDWPLSEKSSKQKYPIFSWCGSHETKDIVMPTYDITESTLGMMTKVTLDILSVQGNSPPWANKSDLAFWRGRDSREERLNLVMLSKKHPDLVDAMLTNMFFFPKDEKKYGRIVEPVSFFDFFKHKYQLNIDGTVAAYRFPYLLAGSSVVLKQDSHYYEHFYNELTPYVHYIPVKRNLSNLLDQLRWAKEHENEVKNIVENAQNYVLNRLLPKDIICYHAILINKYSKLLKAKPIPDSTFTKVDQPSDDDSYCQCHRKKPKKTHEEL